MSIRTKRLDDVVKKLSLCAEGPFESSKTATHDAELRQFCIGLGRKDVLEIPATVLLIILVHMMKGGGGTASRRLVTWASCHSKSFH